MVKDPGKQKKQNSGKPRKTGSRRQEKEEQLAVGKKLKDIVGQWRTAFDAMKDAVSLIDAEGKILRCNKAMSDLLGKPFIEIIGRRCRELVHGASEPVPECPVVRIKETRQRETLELPIGDKWFEVTADPILDESGGFYGAIHIISDITERKQYENKLKDVYADILAKQAAMLNISEDLMREIEERKRIEESLRVSHKFLRIAISHARISPLLNEFVAELRNYTRCAAVGIRILDEEGNIPYQAYAGFSRSFYESESPLSIRSDQCMCINVIRGATDPGQSFYTEGGSFYMNGTSRFLATVSEEDKGKTRNVCNQVGYETVALIPIRVEEDILGLIHVADPQENKAPQAMVEVLEGIAMHLGAAMQRVWAEEKFEKLSHQNELILNSAAEGILGLDLQGNHTFVNPSAAMMLGYEVNELTGKHSHTTWHYAKADGSINPANECPIYSTFKDGEVHNNIRDEVFWKKDGTSFSVSYSSTPIKDEGKLIGAVVNFRDITELRIAEAALRESEERYKRLVNAVTSYTYSVEVRDGHAISTRHSLGCVSITGYNPEDYESNPGLWYEMIYPDDGMMVETWTEKVFAGHDVSPIEHRLIRRDGEAVWVRNTIVPYYNEKGLLIRYDGLIEDITERKHAEERIKNYQERLSYLSSQLSLAEEEERRQIATELHDVVGQNLALSKIKLGMLQDSSPSPEFTGGLVEIYDLIEETIKFTRTLTFDISPPILYELSFEAAVEWLGERLLKKHKIGFRFEDDKQPKPLSDESRVFLFQSVRELMMNIVKHSKAQNANVSIQRKGDDIHIGIKDNGVGFNASDIDGRVMKAESFGLFSIKEHLRSINGTVEITSGPGQGTLATIVAPLTV